MKVWPVQHAKACLSELLDTCLKEGPQLVTRRGHHAAVPPHTASGAGAQSTSSRDRTH